MTSDKKRAQKENDKYVEFKGKIEKKSYVNIKQIIKRKNIKEQEQTELQANNFLELLEIFYNYQMKLEPKSETFREIESRTRILLEILRKKERLNIQKDRVSGDELRELESIGNMDKIMILYGTKLLYDYKENKQKSHEIENEFFTSQKDINYAKRLLRIYQEIKITYMDKSNSSDLDNELRKVYCDEKSNCYLFNINTMFGDIVKLLKLTKSNSDLSNCVEKIITKEKEKEEQAQRVILEKQKNKAEQKIKAKNKAEQEKINKLFSKYGRFDIDYFK